MKTYYLLLIIFILSCSYSLEAQVKKESSPKRELGTVYKDSFPEPEVVEFKLGPKIPKDTYLVNQKPYSLDADYGKEVISSITPKDGLPSKSYRDLEFDKSGNIWIDSEFLMKYNGNDFKELELERQNFYTSKVLIDQDNHLWIHRYKNTSTSIETKIVVFDGIRFQTVDGLEVKSNDLDNRVGVSMYKGTNNSIWVINTKDQLLLKYEGKTKVASYNIEDLSLGRFLNLQDLGDEGLFLLESDDILTIIKDDTFKSINLKTILPDTRIIDVFIIDSETFYATSTSGTYFIKNNKAKLITEERLRLATIDSMGFIWSDFSSISKIKDSLTLKFDKFNFNNSSFTYISKDKKDKIWVAGQSIIGKFNASLKTYSGLLKDDRFRSSFQTKNGDYYLGSFSNGLIHYNGKSAINYQFSEGNRGNNITSFAEDLNGNIWFTNLNNKLIKFDGKHFQSYSLPGFITIIHYVDSKGHIWFSNSENNRDTQVLYKFDGHKFYKIGRSKDLGRSINKVFEDPSGNIWIACAQGLWKYNNQIFTKFTVQDGLPNNYINTVSGDSKGNIWLGTDNGLSVFDGYSFINYGRAEGIFEKNIDVIIPDYTNNIIWVKGQWSEDVTAVRLNTETMEIKVENYSAEQGFPIPSFREMLLDQEGMLWLGMSNGDLARFDYKTLKKNSKPFPVHFNNIRINGESLVWSELNDKYTEDSLISKTEMISRFGKEKTKEELRALKENFASVRYDSLVPFDFIPVGLRLPYSANSLSFEFYAIDPFLAKSTRFQYFLEGFDKGWSSLNKNNIANYGNLTEGDYTLKVKALNPYGLWSETDYKFTILPPWYRTWWAYAIYGVLLLLLLKQVHNYQKKRTIKKERAKAQERELEQAKEIEKAYNDLKATQQQLIQSEKMASLGELTAGIAHEIQNPLNFVNNFSEVSNELIDEMNEELDNGDIDEAKAISKDVKQNLEKITYHGQRADSIVKGMLQHSRNSSGEKEATDINKLTDEYMRLAYHGLRAKDKSFNATLETSFDEGLQPINIVTQEVGRVILNLFTNAFYAVNEKKHAQTNKDDTYEPVVTASTSSLKSDIIVKVRDNGNGIPKAALKKIFDPFFTTKPTGQGTGLGLSMSFDIIKSHGGQLNVNTKEGEFTEFVISLPIK